MSTLREALGKVGIWSMELRGAVRDEPREAAAELEELGFPAVWIPGLNGDGAVDDIGHLLGAAPRTTVAMGILSIWGQDPVALGERLAVLDEEHGPRALIGLGVSNAHAAAAVGEVYGSPIETMERYLQSVDAAPSPIPASRRFLGALGPRMVDVAADRTAGWHPFLVTPEYSAVQRARVGPAPVIAPHQAVVLDEDPTRARETARNGVGMFIGFPSYQANLRRLGFTDDDFAGGGSDGLIDAVTAWGTVDDVARRIQEHLDAGADHVALHVLTHPSDPVNGSGMPRRQWRELAPVPSALTSR